jgi:hypothetical protein
MVLITYAIVATAIFGPFAAVALIERCAPLRRLFRL